MPRLSRPRARAEDRGAALLLFGQAGLGVAVGAAWWALTRRPGAWLVGEPVVLTTDAYPVARDGTFAVLAALCGLLAGALVLRRAGRRPVAVLLVGLAGALAGALLAAGTGSVLPPTSPRDPAHVTVSAWGVLLVWPLALSALVTLVTFLRALRAWVRAG